MVSYTLLCVLLAFTAVRNGEAFIFDERADCRMSQWAQWSKPYGFGTVFRDRSILRYPSEGGEECEGGLVEAKDVELPPDSSRHFHPLPLPITASLMIDNFLRPTSNPERKRNADSSGMLRDLLLIVDSSGSIGYSEFKKSLYELTTLLGVLCPIPDPFDIKKNRAAFIEFSDSVGVVFDFVDNANTAKLFSAIRNVTYLGEGTCTGDALHEAISLFKTTRGARVGDPNVKPEVLILTDGISNCGPDAVVAARSLQSIADVYALAIGAYSRRGSAEIASYVTTPQSKHLFAIQSYQDLTALVQVILNQLRFSTNPCAPLISQ